MKEPRFLEEALLVFATRGADKLFQHDFLSPNLKPRRISQLTMEFVQRAEMVQQALKRFEDWRQFQEAVNDDVKDLREPIVQIVKTRGESVNSPQYNYVKRITLMYDVMLNLSLPRVINFKFHLQPHQKYYIIQCVAFHT